MSPACTGCPGGAHASRDLPCVDESWWERPVGDRPAQVHVLCPVRGLSEPKSLDPELKGAYSIRVIQGLRPREMARRAEARLRGLHSRLTWRLLRERVPLFSSGRRTAPSTHQGTGVCSGSGFLRPASPIALVAALTVGPRGQHASICISPRGLLPDPGPWAPQTLRAAPGAGSSRA